MPHHAPHPSVVSESVSVAPPPVTTPPRDAHPTIRVIDPWDDP
jgi:hypothetical protein